MIKISNKIIHLVSDVKPASLAMMEQFRILKQNFNVTPMVCSGLPSFAQYAMIEMFDSSSPSVFTFHQRFEHLVKLFREQTIGVITNVYMRHATTVDEPDAAPAAKQNKSGNHLKIKNYF